MRAQPPILDAVRRPMVGLGCAALGGRVSVAESVRVIEAAVDGGVRHLDVARSYGYGAAESAVGAFLQTVDVPGLVVATKVGIRASGRLQQLAALRRIARAVAGASPALRRRIARAASSSLQPGRFGTEDMAASLASSLRAMRLDRVDLLLLHNCAPEDVTDDVVAWLEGRAVAGDIGTWGISTFTDATAAITSVREVPVVQVAAPRAGTVPPGAVRGDEALIRHSVLRGAVGPLARLLAEDEERRRWEEAIGMPLGGDELPAFLLRLAISLEPAGVVLAGTSRPGHARGLGAITPFDAGRASAAQALALAASGPVEV